MIPLEHFLAALHGCGVEFVIVGGVAAQAHGSARVTQDLDVCYNRTDENLQRLVRALSPFDPYLRGAPRGLPFSFSTATLRRGLNFTLTTTVGDIDLLGEITGAGMYDQVSAHSIEVEAFGFTTRIISLPWLIQMKRAAGRPKDLEVIAELEALEEEIEGR